MKRSSEEMQDVPPPAVVAGSSSLDVKTPEESNKLPLNTVLKTMLNFLREYFPFN
jgi:hypothetical protein